MIVNRNITYMKQIHQTKQFQVFRQYETADTVKSCDYNDVVQKSHFQFVIKSY